VLHPVQTFREGFRVAGDELLQRVIAAIVLPGLQSAIEQGGGRFVGEKLRELFSGDTGGMDQQMVQKRRQFALRVLMPLAVAILNKCEVAEELQSLTLDVGEVLALERGGDDAEIDGQDAKGVPSSLIAYIEEAAHDLGAKGFCLAGVTLTCGREDVDAIAREVFQKALSNLAEVIDHLGCDVVLLTGRPSRLPAVRAIVEEMMVVPPHRLISMHAYKTGRWYPFPGDPTHWRPQIHRCRGWHADRSGGQPGAQFQSDDLGVPHEIHRAVYRRNGQFGANSGQQGVVLKRGSGRDQTCQRHRSLAQNVHPSASGGASVATGTLDHHAALPA